jgi:phosphoglucosamine mutase
MHRFFGTDGVRGRANSEPITADTALKLALAAAAQFTSGNHRHRVIIGKDTRLSGYMLESAMSAGFLSMGLDVMLLGPVPTPAVGMLTRSMRADLGVMISASHNPFEDNGIKLFGPDGFKLSDALEGAIETRLTGDMLAALAAPVDLGRAHRIADARGRYIEFVKSSFPKGLNLAGLKIVIDCANGAAYRVAPTVLWELGAEVIAIGVEPSGTNINHECGALHPERMQALVRERQADLGIALDGDADRVIVADERGQVVDGDQLMGVIARSWAQSGRLRNHSVTATVMSNLGLERFLAGHDIALKRTPVGDRHVVEEMRRNGGNLGGEQSGHIVLTDFATTGDGLMAALQVLAVLVQATRPASETLRVFAPLPQCLQNVRCSDRAIAPLERAEVKAAIEAGETELKGKGRLLIRKSGTEPLIRVMAEGEDETLVARVVADIVKTLQTCA